MKFTAPSPPRFIYMYETLQWQALALVPKPNKAIDLQEVVSSHQRSAAGS